MSSTEGKFQFAIDRGGTFTDVFARCPGGKIKVLKLLSEDPQHYNDAPTEGIRRILQEVRRCLKSLQKLDKEEDAKKSKLIKELCQKHIDHRAAVLNVTSQNGKLLHSEIRRKFIASLPQRAVLKYAIRKWFASDMKPFVIKTLQNQIEKNQAVEYLTEMRKVTVLLINIVKEPMNDKHLIALILKAYNVIAEHISNYKGIINKLSLFDKDLMVLVIFGLKGNRHELENQEALISGYKIREQVSKIEGIKSTSVGITNGLVYCGVVGHPLRREYTVIGGAVNKAARLMCKFQNKVTCDYETFKQSKLSSYYFLMQPKVSLKGFEDAGHIFQYNEKFEKKYVREQIVYPLIGREFELDFINKIIENSESAGNYTGVCFNGKSKIGKSVLLKTACLKAEENGNRVASIELCAAFSRPYFCLSNLYKQLYNAKANLKSSDSIESLPSDVWNLNDILQKHNDSALKDSNIMDLLKTVCSNNASDEVAVIFIDNIQYIDERSLKIILTLIGEENVRLVSAGHFDEQYWNIQWEISLNAHMKMIELDYMLSKHIPILVCQSLEIHGVPKKLISLLEQTCEGRPGWIQSSLLRLINNGSLEITLTSEENIDTIHYSFPEMEDNKLKKRHGDLLSVLKLLDNFDNQFEKLTDDSTSLDFFDSFDPYQQLVIKTGAVLGDVFTRSLLIVLLKYPNEQLFTNVIMNLFEEDVFECGTKFLFSGNLLTEKLVCTCYTDEDEKFSDQAGWSFTKLPKYAFCKLIHFRNKVLRCTAYELLPSNQRTELHSRITNLLENQNNLCPNCLRDDSAAIIKMIKYKQMMQYCSNRYLKYSNNWETESKEIDFEDIIRKHIYSEGLEEDEEPYENVVPFKRKVWDRTTCFCLEIMTKVYSDLIMHSRKAGLLMKQIFYLTQYGSVLLILEEFEDAIPVLTEACELCVTDSRCKNSDINQTFRKVHMGKIHTFLAEAHFRLDEIVKAKMHIIIGFRQYNVPIIAMTYKLPHVIFKRSAALKIPKTHRKGYSGIKRMFNTDFGNCLNLAGIIYSAEGNWDLAKSLIKRSLHFLQIGNPSISILCDSYSTAIEMYNYCGDTHICEQLERYVGKKILKSFTGNLVTELYSVSRLIFVIFASQINNGLINKAIRIGYRGVDLNISIHALYIQSMLIPILASALLLTQKIEKAVSLMQLMYNESGLLDFYSFCIELNLETSFLLENLDFCHDFAEKYFEDATKHTYNDKENKLIIFLCAYYFRLGDADKAAKWKSMINLEKLGYSSFISVSNLFKYTESLMLHLVKNVALKRPFQDLQEISLGFRFKELKTASNKWKLFKPRYFHYKAYYCKLKHEEKSCKKYLSKALKLAKKQENLLEISWINHNKNAWNGGLNFGENVKNIPWKLANTYTQEQYSQIMFTLPLT